MTDKKSESIWKSFKDNFPWKDMFLGFLIPKVFFLYGARHGMPFLWGGFIFWKKRSSLSAVGTIK